MTGTGVRHPARLPGSSRESVKWQAKTRWMDGGGKRRMAGEGQVRNFFVKTTGPTNPHACMEKKQAREEAKQRHAIIHPQSTYSHPHVHTSTQARQQYSETKRQAQPTVPNENKEARGERLNFKHGSSRHFHIHPRPKKPERQPTTERICVPAT